MTIVFRLGNYQREISIHILRVEDDNAFILAHAYFVISIHILRVEDDVRDPKEVVPLPYFNPHPPCGG